MLLWSFVGLLACTKTPSTASADSVAKSDTTSAVPPSDVVGKQNDDAKSEAPQPKTVVPAGTKLRVALLDAVSSDKSRAGDRFLASLAEPIVIEGKTILEKGTKVRGRVIDAKESGRVKGRATVELKLTEIVLNDDHALSISTKPYTAVAEATKKRDAAIIGGGAGLGAVIGAIAGGGKGAAIGAAVGGGAGTGTVLATKGKEIHYAPETRLQFTLASSIEI
jgi:hypothetical protein